MTKSNIDRQQTLEHLMDDALKDKNLLQALEAYSMGQAEYKRAISASTIIKITTGNSSNPRNLEEFNYAHLDRD